MLRRRSAHLDDLGLVKTRSLFIMFQYLNLLLLLFLLRRSWCGCIGGCCYSEARMWPSGLVMDGLSDHLDVTIFHVDQHMTGIVQNSRFKRTSACIYPANNCSLSPNKTPPAARLSQRLYSLSFVRPY